VIYANQDSYANWQLWHLMAFSSSG